MRIITKILLSIGIISIIGFIVVFDIADRNQFFSNAILTDELNEFYLNNETPEQKQKAFERNFGNEKYSFPRNTVSKIKILKNKFLISRLTSTKVSEKNKSKLLSFFNNPDNFNWSETTWDLGEAEYILRFYDYKNNEVGKIWLCLDGCGMINAIPFSPNMKYGGLSNNGKKRINNMVKDVLTK